MSSVRADRGTSVSLWAGGILFWGVLVGLSLSGAMALMDAILIAFLLVMMPTLAVVQLPAVDEVWIERLPVYKGSILALWMLGTGSWLVGTRTGGPAAVGVVWLPVVPLLAWTLVLTVAGLGILVLFRSIGSVVGVREAPLVRQLLPRTPGERRFFAILSVAAGVGEELAYRGYAIPVLLPLIGLGGSVVVTTVVFAWLHAYQGLFGVLRTGLMGALLAWGFVVSGSLLPAIAAHALIDMIVGLVLGPWLVGSGNVATMESA